MSRSATLLIVVLVVIIGGFYVLSTIDAEQPQTRVEKPIANEALAK